MIILSTCYMKFKVVFTKINVIYADLKYILKTLNKKSLALFYYSSTIDLIRLMTHWEKEYA